MEQGFMAPCFLIETIHRCCPILNRKMTPMTNPTDTACRKCGTCCRKGGPALHGEDRFLVIEGLIPAENLYTIRPGEPVQDNVTGHRAYADGDIIKIKGQGDSWCCCFLNDADSCCTVYDRRPVECRALQCWDTRAIEALYAKDRLTREDLLGAVEGLWELILDHENRCAYRLIREQVERLALKPPENTAAIRTITEMVKYDESLRKLLVESGHAPEAMLDFLLGRPLVRTLPGFHIKVEQDAGKIRLVHSPLT